MKLWIPLLGLLGLVSCIPSVDNAPDRAAAHYCTRADDCTLLGDGEWDSCVDDFEDSFEFLWDQDRCEDNGFDRELWWECWDAIGAWDCDDLLMGWIEIADDCAASEVCPI